MCEYVSAVLDENITELQQALSGDGTLICHRFQPILLGNLRLCLCCIDGLASSKQIQDHILWPISALQAIPAEGTDLLDFLQQQVLLVAESTKEDRFSALLHALLYGDSILFADGCSKALILGTKGFEKRSISEPSGETYLKGPREGFVEPMLHNLAMLRRKLRTEDLKLEYFTLGSETRTDCCICYLSSAVDRRVLSELRERLSNLVIDGIFDTNYIAEMIRDHRFSPFRTTGSSERPDVVAAKLLEGRIAVFTDGSPIALTVPHIFLEQLQSGEDYYLDSLFAGINRALRLIGFFAAISVLPVYLSLVTFHQAFMPLPLILSIAKARQGVPFPIFLEAVLLLLAFDILREAGTRTPSSIGQTLSVVGGLVIGQAAVDARLVSVPVLIIVAVSGICSLITPKLKAAVMLCRLFLMLLSVSFGFYGFLLGFLAVLLVLAQQESFGIPYLSGFPLSGVSAEDSVLRAPFWKMQKFGRFLARKTEKQEDSAS